MSNELFYQNLKSFAEFKQLLDEDKFQTMPNDWIVIISDVKGSTKAIESGKYRDVNTMGAATIVAAQKAMGEIDFPYVFGGDGATLIVPPSKYEEVIEELIALRDLSSSHYNLELRIGAIPVSEISNNAKIMVAKFELKAGKCIAIFNGGGLNFAEEKIKDKSESYIIKKESTRNVDLTGLSCRWNPIKNRRGKILSLLIEAISENKENVYKEVLAKLDEIFEGKLEQANPVNFEKATYKSISQCYQDEKRMHNSILSLKFLMRYIEIVFAVIIFKLNIKLPVFDSDSYVDSMVEHSDYRKFDDMLRMIIDCNQNQHDQISTYLSEQKDKGLLKYGIHESEDCLMTCYLQEKSDGKHIHFIDGGNGGYAMAAKQLKAM